MSDSLCTVLLQCADKHLDFVANQLAPGIIASYNFHKELWRASNPGKQSLPKGVYAVV